MSLEDQIQISEEVRKKLAKEKEEKGSETFRGADHYGEPFKTGACVGRVLATGSTPGWRPISGWRYWISTQRFRALRRAK